MSPRASSACWAWRAMHRAQVRVVLAGSSLGAWIAGHVSLQVPVAGLFLMAPPIVLDAAHPLDAAQVPTSIIHGWHDELIPAADVVAWARTPQRTPAAGRRQPSPVVARAGQRRCVRGAVVRSRPMKFFASCGKGLEYLLADELLALGCSRATAALAGANVGRQPRRCAARGAVVAPGQPRAVADRRIRMRRRTCLVRRAPRPLPWPEHLASRSYRGRRRACLGRCDHARALRGATRQGCRRRRHARADRHRGRTSTSKRRTCA